MEGVEISDPNNLYDVISKSCKFFSNSLSIRYPISFVGHSVVDGNQTIGSGVELFGENYSMVISLFSEKGRMDLVPFLPEFEEGIKKCMPSLELVALSESEIYIGDIDQNSGLYGVESGQNEGGGFIDVFCGMKGLLPRSFSKREDFVETVEDISYFANLFFKPFITRRKRNRIHYLTLTRE